MYALSSFIAHRMAALVRVSVNLTTSDATNMLFTFMITRFTIGYEGGLIATVKRPTLAALIDQRQAVIEQ